MSLDALPGAFGLDRYSVMARLRPALLSVLPIAVVVGYWVPQSILTALGISLTTLTTCGLTYLLSMFARTRGLALEQRLGERVGRLRSARMLTFADDAIVQETKVRYHRYLADHGCVLSSPDEEIADPVTAFARARSAVDRLLVLTKKPQQNPRLLDETIYYGFARNLCGLRPYSLAILAALMLTNGALMLNSWNDRPTLAQGAAIEVVLVAVAIAWLLIVTEAWVCSASASYAQRFFEHCEGA